MKVKRKLLTCVLCVALVFAMAAPSFAAESDDCFVSSEEFFAPEELPTHEEIVATIFDDPNSVTYNEFDLILQEKEAAKTVLNSRSASFDERKDAEKTLAFDPVQTVYDYQRETDEDLMSRGFDKERIEIIRNFKGTEAELRRAAASVTISGTPKYATNEGGNWAKVTMSFAWSAAPFWAYTDGVVAGVSQGFLAESVPDTKCVLHYNGLGTTGQKNYDKTYGRSSMKVNPFSEHKIQGFAFPLHEEKWSNEIGREINYIAMSGSSVMVFKSAEFYRSVGLSYGYAHAKTTIDVGISLEFTSGTIGVSLNFGLPKEKYDLTASTFSSYTYPKS